MATALVTGGTAGIGNAFARALAARGDDVVIVARDTERMETIAADLRARYGVDVECLTADLAVRADVDMVAGRIEDPSRRIDTVINNAGFGLHAKLLDPDALDLQERAMDVMCWAVLQLSAAAGRAMAPRGHGTIINVSSTSAWINSGNYSAIKAWVLSFTEALALELAGTGVTATALCPGWVKTEFHTRAGVTNKNLPEFVWVDPDLLVRECLADAAKGKPVSIPTFRWKAAIFVAQHGPQSLMFYVSKRLMASRHRQKVSPKVSRLREKVS
ncbi:MAG TPA: SDR family NAD(P)-dependent oxidoreductase [Propionibacteriaceae bacterium]|nr:SDR family NAD(P)-dependent oxidoreductase [Propionibacteriaceae bacterium]